MTHTQFEVRFTDSRRRQQVMRAAIHADGNWLVESVADGRPFTRQCSRWQSVERTLAWLRRHAQAEVPPQRREHGSVAAVITALMILFGSAAAFAQMTAVESDAVKQFTAATRDYAWTHRRIENTLDPLTVTANPDVIHRLVEQMAAAMRAERPNARQGEFFTSALAIELRRRIADALAAHEFTPDDIRAMEAADGIDAAMVPLEVNGPFPWIYASAMFPCVRDALPELPAELQYRIVGSTLILIDVHAGLIVDLLPQALAGSKTER